MDGRTDVHHNPFLLLHDGLTLRHSLRRHDPKELRQDPPNLPQLVIESVSIYTLSERSEESIYTTPLNVKLQTSNHGLHQCPQSLRGLDRIRTAYQSQQVHPRCNRTGHPRRPLHGIPARCGSHVRHRNLSLTYILIWMSKSKTTTPATSVVESVSSSTRKATARTGTTTTSVKIAKQRGTSALNSNPTTETTMTIDNFFGKPVGSAVLFLNGFQFGKRLNDLNRCARLVPDDVKGMASMLSNTPQAGPATAKLAIDQLVSWADDAEQLEDSLRSEMFTDSEKFTA